MASVPRFLTIVAPLACGMVIACVAPPTNDLPPLEWEGERVVFGTNLVDDVCVGTLASLDASVESIELELELDPFPKKISFYVLDDESIADVCGPFPTTACVKRGRIYSSSRGWKNKRHELAHVLVEVRTIPLFDEGIAAALDQDGGCLDSSVCDAADLDVLLTAAGHTELSMYDGYTAGADLLHGMLTVHGPARVLAFMAELATMEGTPSEVRSLYLEHFGSVLDEDFQTFKRGSFDEYTLAQRGCDGLFPAPSAGADGVIEIHGVMDCQSPEVVNSFVNESRGIIERTFEVTPEQSGAFVVSWPNDEVLSIERCDPPLFGWREGAEVGLYADSWAWHVPEDRVTFAAGQYKVRWLGDFGTTLDLALIPPCIFEAGGCPVGEQCNIWNECHPQVGTPAALGEPCEQLDSEPLACEAGSRCLGGLCVAECDSTQPCEAGQACSRFRTCGPICSLLEQDCEPNFACLPSDDDALNSAGMGVCIAAGPGEFFDTCDRRGSDCQAGLSCEPIGGAPSGTPCADKQDDEGCCVPLCDAGAATSECPLEAYECDAIREGPVGVCRT